jgi:hypothetical protein
MVVQTSLLSWLNFSVVLDRLLSKIRSSVPKNGPPVLKGQRNRWHNSY